MNGTMVGNGKDYAYCPNVVIPPTRDVRGYTTTIGYPNPYKVDNKFMCDTSRTYTPYG
jgi:hypothetical protein